ncbi:MAG: SRPBCC domain-containing protein [Cyclobacteriaceae bacterium]
MDNIENRQLRQTRTFKVPIDLMWEVWTQPEHIMQWWGPTGFTNTNKLMDFREGGEWLFTMHGPDGKDYANRSLFKEIVPKEKIVFEHFGPHFITTVLFISQGDETLIDWTVELDSEEILKTLVREVNAAEGQKQNLDKLEQYLLKRQTK